MPAESPSARPPALPARADVVVIGAGLVGLAAAWQLLRTRPGAQVAVLEREPEPARHQSGRNSGVIHAGLAYRPGSLKARLAVEGRRELIRFCRERSIRLERCGKLIVACDEVEARRLPALLAQGAANGLKGLRLLRRAEIAEREPMVAGVAALWVPQEGIVDYPAVARALAEDIQARGGTVRTSAGVHGIRRDGAEGWIIQTEAGELRAGFIVNCAGLQCDRVARLAGERPALRTVAFRGEYFRLRDACNGILRTLVYPVADPRFPFLGIHLTRTVAGPILVGPNAVPTLARDRYDRGAVNLRDAWDAATHRGTWRFLARHAGTVAAEIRRSLDPARFLAAAQRLVPSLTGDDLVPHEAGHRAQAIGPDGQLAEDFVILARADALHVLNAPSPGATAALAFGAELVRRLDRLVPGPARTGLGAGSVA